MLRSRAAATFGVITVFLSMGEFLFFFIGGSDELESRELMLDEEVDRASSPDVRNLSIQASFSRSFLAVSAACRLLLLFAFKIKLLSNPAIFPSLGIFLWLSRN